MKDHVRSSWRGALLICAKCDRKLDGGFGPKGGKRLAKALAEHPDTGRKRKAALGVATVRCLGICPKGAVTVVDTRVPDRWRLVRPGDDLDALVAGTPAIVAPEAAPVLFKWLPPRAEDQAAE